MRGFRILACALALLAAAAPQDLGTPAPQAVKLMVLPPGFKAHVFAAEPDIRQPNAFCIDDRGRLWVAENFTYAGPGGPWKPSGKDTILMFEDTDGDGKFDKRTVFADNLSFISGLEVGFGGVWVGSPPNLLFIPDKDGKGKADGPPQVVLDGWGHHDQHETLNSFIWGPDGWLYGCHGVFTHSKVGKPGTPDDQRTTINAAIWRYHPVKQVFEKFAEGTSNPWGVDFDANGQMFIEACVIPHLWYVIQGGRYQRQGGQHENKYTYEDIKTIADHKHDGIQGRKGGHAHGGARFVLNDVFPPEYQGKFIIGTIHHHGMYTEAFERKGSGYTGKHVGDFLMANDPLYLGFNHEFGPDGALYVIDWYDPRPCHGQTPAHIDTGRIYKITYGESKKVDVDLTKLSSMELVKLQLSTNDWYVRHARRLLEERGPDPALHKTLVSMIASTAETPKKLRLLWALHVTGGATESFLLEQLKSPEEFVRGWAIQLLLEDRKPTAGVLKQLVLLAKEDPSAVVRLYVAAAAQRVAPAERWEIVEALAAHPEDAADHNLPTMLWYATEPLVMLDNGRAVKLATASKVPRLRELITRRMVAGSSGNAAPPPVPKVEPAKSVPNTGLALLLKPKAGEIADTSDAARKVAAPSTDAQPKAVEVLGRSGLKFDGVDDCLVIPHAADLAFKAADSFTISAWVHLKEVPQDGWRGVVTKSRDAKPWYGLWIEAEGHWVFGGGRNLMGSGALTGWQHVCAVQEGGAGRKLYLNGGLGASGAAEDGSGTGDLWIGGAKTTQEYLNGTLGEVRIYRRALDASEVLYLAQNP
jgi:putative membrane-bound dehydrogenase-like protein